MSVLTPIKDEVQQKVHNSQYIRTENEPEKADTKPAETEISAPEVK